MQHLSVIRDINIMSILNRAGHNCRSQGNSDQGRRHNDLGVRTYPRPVVHITTALRRKNTADSASYLNQNIDVGQQNQPSGLKQR